MKTRAETTGENCPGPAAQMDAEEVSSLHEMLIGVTNSVPQSSLDHTGSNVLFLSIHSKEDIFVLERAQCKVI